MAYLSTCHYGATARFVVYKSVDDRDVHLEVFDRHKGKLGYIALTEDLDELLAQFTRCVEEVKAYRAAHPKVDEPADEAD